MVGLISTVWNLSTSHVVMYCELRRSCRQVSFSKIVYDVTSLYTSREQSYCFTDFGIDRPTQIPSCGSTVRWQIPSSLSCPFPAQFISKPTYPILNSSTFKPYLRHTPGRFAWLSSTWRTPNRRPTRRIITPPTYLYPAPSTGLKEGDVLSQIDRLLVPLQHALAHACVYQLLKAPVVLPAVATSLLPASLRPTTWPDTSSNYSYYTCQPDLPRTRLSLS